MEHWWNDTDRGQTITWGKPISMALSPPQILHGITWDRLVAFAVRGRRVFGDNIPQTKSRHYPFASHINCPGFGPRTVDESFGVEKSGIETGSSVSISCSTLSVTILIHLAFGADKIGLSAAAVSPTYARIKHKIRNMLNYDT